MLSLTLLDGTTIGLPPKKPAASRENMSAKELVAALRAAVHGGDAEAHGEPQRWEPVVAALLAVLVKKGIITDAEFVEELRKT